VSCGQLHDPLLDGARQDATGAKDRVNPIASEARENGVEVSGCRHSEHLKRDSDRLSRLFSLGNRPDMASFRGRRAKMATRDIAGTACFSNRSLLVVSPVPTSSIPVTIPPGRLAL
jgi:hypothetical protein